MSPSVITVVSWWRLRWIQMGDKKCAQHFVWETTSWEAALEQPRRRWEANGRKENGLSVRIWSGLNWLRSIKWQAKLWTVLNLSFLLTSYSYPKNFPPFMGPKGSLSSSQSTHWTLSWATWIQSTPSHPISLKSILILSSHLCLNLPSGLFPSDLRTEHCMHLSSITCVKV
jgi:hypothetical protein